MLSKRIRVANVVNVVNVINNTLLHGKSIVSNHYEVQRLISSGFLRGSTSPKSSTNMFTKCLDVKYMYMFPPKRLFSSGLDKHRFEELVKSISEGKDRGRIQEALNNSDIEIEGELRGMVHGFTIKT